MKIVTVVAYLCEFSFIAIWFMYQRCSRLANYLENETVSQRWEMAAHNGLWRGKG
jgi:hypothetical protein